MKYKDFCQLADQHGWTLDTSPVTELSDLTWWRHGATYKLKTEEELLDYLLPPFEEIEYEA